MSKIGAIVGIAVVCCCVKPSGGFQASTTVLKIRRFQDNGISSLSKSCFDRRIIVKLKSTEDFVERYDPCASVYGCSPPGPGDERNTQLALPPGHDDEIPVVVGVGLVGCGRIGKVHLETLSRASGARVVIVSNPDVKKAEDAAKMFNVAEWTSNEDEVIEHPDVEAVWICSPSAYHASQIIKCAKNNKHVFCEKPVATNLNETISAIRAMERKNLKLMIALQRRFDPSFQRVKTGILRGEIGEPILVKLCSRDPAPPPARYVKGSGGIFKDQAIHDLDMSRFFMASEPTEILASGMTCVSDDILHLDGPEKYDTATIIVRFANGREAIIDVCRQAPYGYDQRAEVLGTKGMLCTDNMHPTTASLYTRERYGSADHPYDFFMSRYREAYAAETRAFVECLVYDRPTPISGQDGLVALIMAIAAGKSAEERRWVSFAEILGGDESDAGPWIKGARALLGKELMERSDIVAVFQILDVERDGYISTFNIKEALNRLGEYPSNAELTRLVRIADVDNDGRLSAQDFEDLFCAFLRVRQ
uniref:EF-hand domain-containing protein n=1 Tax=Aureoumbra lagunensis TaxID=44058 RepID=A0A6S8B8Q1_9STRA|mmetsp:Transcript_18439/g.23989  ORF Transcript_18439/g.23989 Transcript_18439/m.23989 type:complete len:535 (+) Transcript_18439:76-1680(+)